MCQNNKCCDKCNGSQIVKFSGFNLDSIFSTINAGIGALGQLGILGGGGNASGQAKGLAAITQATNQILSALSQIVQQFGSATAQQKAALLQQAIELEQVLYNSAAIYQAKKGKDADVLKKAKDTAKNTIAQLQSIAQNQTVPNGNTGSVAAPINTNQTFSALFNLDEQSKQLLLYGGLGVIGLLIFSNFKAKKK